MAKWDIKDGFWRMDCAAGEEWNFAYVLPQEEGQPTTLVVPTSLQMGWVESPPYFCAATETSRDISTEYIETEVNSLHRHKFEHSFVGALAYTNLPESGQDPQGFWYMVEVYVDDFMSLVIPVSMEQLRHVAKAIMHGIHDVFPPDSNDDEDPISEKKMKKGEGLYDTKKTLLGFDFDGDAKTMWLDSAKQEKLLTILKGWIRTGKQRFRGNPAWRLRVNHFKDTACISEHPCGMWSTIAVQPRSQESPTICISATECGSPHGAGGVSNPPP